MSRRPMPARTLRLVGAGVAVLLAGGVLSGCGAGPDAHGAAPAASSAAGLSSVAGRVAGRVAGPVDAGPAPATATASQAPARDATSSTRGGHVDRIEVGKCWTNATKSQGGQLLISARSSDPAAHLRAYRPDGSLIGDVGNGGGQRYGGTVFAYERSDPGWVTIRSSAGGSLTVPTTPFRVED